MFDAFKNTSCRRYRQRIVKWFWVSWKSVQWKP